MGNKAGKGVKVKKNSLKSEDTNVSASLPIVEENYSTNVGTAAMYPTTSSNPESKSIKKRDVEDHNDVLTKTTHFTSEEIDMIRQHMKTLLNHSSKDSIVLTKEQFEQILDLKSSSLYSNRLFNAFASGSGKTLSFSDLIHALSVLSHKGTYEEKVKLSFQLLDFENRGYITKEDTKTMLESCLRDCKDNDVQITLTDQQVDTMIKYSFEIADLNKNGVIELNEYEVLLNQSSFWYSQLHVDIPGIINRLDRRRSSSLNPNEIGLTIQSKKQEN